LPEDARTEKSRETLDQDLQGLMLRHTDDMKATPAHVASPNLTDDEPFLPGQRKAARRLPPR
jgi:hypothetical protein